MHILRFSIECGALSFVAWAMGGLSSFGVPFIRSFTAVLNTIMDIIAEVDNVLCNCDNEN